MRTILPIVGMLAVSGCASAMRGPDTCAEIHFDTTYVLARWAGWPEADALTIAASNFWTDKHDETNSVATEWRLLGGVAVPISLPWVICAGVADVLDGESPSRAFGRRVAESTAWAVPALGHRLHFPAVGLHSAVMPAFYVNPVSGEIEYGNAEARLVLERAFLEFQSHAEDADASLSLLGVGLHTLQDSFKHSGYTAARGHIGADPDPDHACCDLRTTLLSAEVTLNSLRYARRLATGSSSAPPKGWRKALERVFLESRSGEDAQARVWAQFAQDQFGDALLSRRERLERWRVNQGLEAFDRALDRVKDAVR